MGWSRAMLRAYVMPNGKNGGQLAPESEALPHLAAGRESGEEPRSMCGGSAIPELHFAGCFLHRPLHR